MKLHYGNMKNHLVHIKNKYRKMRIEKENGIRSFESATLD